MFGRKDDKRADLEVFTFYDSKAQVYGNPTFAINHHDLIRQILNMFIDPEQQQKNVLFLNAEDYSLFRIGTFDKSTGEIRSTGLEHIANFNDLRSTIQQKAPAVHRAPDLGIVGT